MKIQFGGFWVVITNLGHIILGVLLLLVGVSMDIYEIQQKAPVKLFIYVGTGLAIFGALLIPTILPLAKQIVVVFFPNGLPLPGGKRIGDPPANPPSPPTSGPS